MTNPICDAADPIRPGRGSSIAVFSILADLVKVKVKRGTLLFTNKTNVFM